MKRNYINPEIVVVRFAENLMQDINMSVHQQSVGFGDVLGKGNDFDEDFDDADDTGFPMWED